MVDNMDLSLEQLIRINKKKKSTTKKQGKISQKNDNGSPKKKRGVVKGGAHGGITRSKYKKPENKNKRKVDLIKQAPKQALNAPKKPTKMVVANLDFGVSDADMKELFSKFGPMKKAVVHYDRSGRSLGTADLIFVNRNDAIKAIKQLNGVPLDGRPMKLTITEAENPATMVQVQRQLFKNNKKPQTQQNRKLQRARGKKGSPSKSQKRQPKPKVTAENLDAELEAYRNAA